MFLDWGEDQIATLGAQGGSDRVSVKPPPESLLYSQILFVREQIATCGMRTTANDTKCVNSYNTSDPEHRKHTKPLWNKILALPYNAKKQSCVLGA